MDILETNQLFGNVPGEELIQLLRELLDVDKNKAKADRQFAARYDASWILAQDERVSTRVLARTLGVNASSISRWRSEPAFREMIQRNQKTIADLESRGRWPPKLKSTCLGTEGQRLARQEGAGARLYVKARNSRIRNELSQRAARDRGRD